MSLTLRDLAGGALLLVGFVLMYLLLALIVPAHATACPMPDESWAPDEVADPAGLVSDAGTEPRLEDGQVRAAILYLSPRLATRRGDQYVDQLATAISREAQRINEDPLLIVALCYVESSFAVEARGPRIRRFRGRGTCRCEGLMQLHPDHDWPDPFDIDSNIEGGCTIFAEYRDQRGSVRGGLNRYGTATGRVLGIYSRLQREFDAA